MKLNKRLVIYKGGFTLVEVIVAIGIISLLLAVVVPSYKDARANSRDKSRISDLAQIQLAIKLYQQQNNGDYPIGDGQVCLACTTNINSAVQTYVGKIQDPRHDGTNYVYKYYDSTTPKKVCAETMETSGYTSPYCLDIR